MPWKVDPKIRGIRRHVYFEDPSQASAYEQIPAIIEVGPVQDDGQRRNRLADAVAAALNEAKVIP